MDLFDRGLQLCRNSEKVIIFFVAEAVSVMVRTWALETDFLGLYLGSAVY